MHSLRDDDILKTQTPGAAGLIAGRYQPIRELGRGGMGEVLLVRDTVSGVDFALKRIPDDVARSHRDMEDLRSTYVLVQKLSHPYIANYKTLERDQTTGAMYLIMEFVEGLSLDLVLRRDRRLSEDVAKQLLRQMGEALDFAHNAGVMHRDIKPSNILVQTDGTAKLIDFGLAAQVQSSLTRLSMMDTSRLFQGTRPYMAPELWRGRRPCKATDQWALAATIYEALSGDPPWISDDPAILGACIMNQQPEALAGISEPFRRAIERGLAKNPDDRWPTLADMVRAAHDDDAAARLACEAAEREAAEHARREAVADEQRRRLAEEARHRQEAESAAEKKRREDAERKRQEEEEKRQNDERKRQEEELKRQAVEAEAEQERLRSRWLDPLVRASGKEKCFEETLVSPAGWLRAARYEYTRCTRPIDEDRRIFADSDGERLFEDFSFVRIPAGTFVMGSPATERGRSYDEDQHEVAISRPFEMMTTPVTQALWMAVMGDNPSYFKGVDLPVEMVSWEDCQGFIARLNSLLYDDQYRLPTEAEWEYACRAGTVGPTYGPIDEIAWYEENSGNGTLSVGRKTPNAWGLYDMLGNVWEWCSDWYSGYHAGSVTDPSGPLTGSYRVSRGGSWKSSPGTIRVANRYQCYPDDRYNRIGFRIARSVD